jgi:IS30 family transposase
MKLSEETREKITTLRQLEWSPKRIARELKLKEATVRKELGLKPHPYRGPRRNYRRVDWSTLPELIEKGLTRREIAEELGAKYRTVCVNIRKRGLDCKPDREPTKPKAPPKKRGRKPIRIPLEVLLPLVEEDLTLPEICSRLLLSRYIVKRELERHKDMIDSILDRGDYEPDYIWRGYVC